PHVQCRPIHADIEGHKAYCVDLLTRLTRADSRGSKGLRPRCIMCGKLLIDKDVAAPGWKNPLPRSSFSSALQSQSSSLFSACTFPPASVTCWSGWCWDRTRWG